MTSRSALILGIIVLMVGSAAAFLCYIRDHQRLGKPGVKIVAENIYGIHGQLVSTNSVYLPEKVLHYTSKPMPIADKMLDWLPKDTTYGQRLYEAEDGFRAQLSVVLMGMDRTSLHRPEFCLPAQGWVVGQHELTNISITQPHPYSLPVMKLKTRLEGRLPTGETVNQSGIFIYWFVTNGQISARHSEYMRSILMNLLLKGELQRWAYVSCFAPCLPGQEEAVFARAQELITAAVPQFQLVAGPPLPIARRANALSFVDRGALPFSSSHGLAQASYLHRSR